MTVDVEFSGELWSWHGPAPWHFITVPAEECALIEDVSDFVTYGWGMVPATIRIGATEWQTSLYPHEGRYIVPIKAAVRRAEDLAEGDQATVRVTVRIDA